MIKAFSEKHPGIHLQINESSSANLYEKLLTEEVDLIVDSGIYNKNLYESIPLLADHILLAVPQNNQLNASLTEFRLTQSDIMQGLHLHGQVPDISLKTFRNENFLLLGKGNDLHRRALNLCQNSDFVPKVSPLFKPAHDVLQHGQARPRHIFRNRLADQTQCTRYVFGFL